MLKKAFIILFITLLCAGNSSLLQLGRLSMEMISSWDSCYMNSFANSVPVGSAEEKSENSTAGANELVEDDEFLSFRWASKILSGSSDLSEHHASLLFKNIDREILVPPPRG
jgi:hypothetical protein